MPDFPELDEFLAKGYRYQAMTQGNVQALVLDYQHALEDDEALRAASEAKLRTLQGIPADRCFISKVERDLLKLALGAPL